MSVSIICWRFYFHKGEANETHMLYYLVLLNIYATQQQYLLKAYQQNFADIR